MGNPPFPLRLRPKSAHASLSPSRVVPPQSSDSVSRGQILARNADRPNGVNKPESGYRFSRSTLLGAFYDFRHDISMAVKCIIDDGDRRNIVPIEP